MSRKLISVSSLKTLLEDGQEFEASAIKIRVIKGYFLILREKEGVNSYTLSTWRSSSPKVFKTADALIKEAEGFGFNSVIFELGDAGNGA